MHVVFKHWMQLSCFCTHMTTTRHLNEQSDSIVFNQATTTLH